MRLNKRKSGFTLIEIAVVIGILGILLGIGIPVFRNSMANRQLDASAEELAASLRYTQQIARAEGSATLDFTRPPSGLAAFRGYSIVDSAGNIKRQSTIPSSVNLSSGPGNAITFNANGTTNAGGDITLSSIVTTRSKVVNIVQATGLITVR